MRKKSHISLARDIVRHTQDEDLKQHRFAFYLGSILPDIKPSFLYRKHEISATFDKVRQDIRVLSDKIQDKKGQKRKYYRNLGQITHYIADYFTFPHNQSYTGGLKEHCSYEKKLKNRLKEYLGDTHREIQDGLHKEFINSDALCDFIEQSHHRYLKQKMDVDWDIRHIVSLNHQVVEGIKQLAQKSKPSFRKHSA